MERYFDKFKIKTSPKAKESHVIVNGSTRITVLTPCMVRVEETKNGKFCDEPTQAVWFRDFDMPRFEVKNGNGFVEIKTTKCNFLYSFTEKKMVRIKLRDGRVVTDYRSGNLKGTCRTLDVTAGIITLGDGVCSKDGVAILDDSKTLILTDDGKILPRKSSGKDEYYFAYGYDYIGATRDLYKLTGETPLIPRYALSNWWSRYKAYTQEEYLKLMDRFKKEEIPITVATVDMDWHWVDIRGKFGKDVVKPSTHLNFMEYIYDVWSVGWTGYSFNTDLFPDPQGFLKKLQDDNYKVTFNLHPSQGVRWYEDCYEEMCEKMGQDPSTKEPVQFDITDEKFVEHYFKVLHHPMEKMGVDFWWIDWQQGTRTKIKGLDPLWALNHYHFLDNAKDNNRPLILSRFAGAGSQRYPLGFSGDTTQKWSSLDFQVYFTATASNVGYPWWSHDIGGHCWGKKDDELYIRWVQFGIYSPVMRLHSTVNEFMGKEPWKYSAPIEKIATENLRFRHKLLPYIYTMNRRTQKDGRAICEPMYYTYPKEENAYNIKNQYFFGTELIVAPITEHTNSEIGMASAKVWLPEGRYTDIYNGRIYTGNRVVKMFRDISTIPVLAKEGAIIPMSKNEKDNTVENPVDLELLIFRGNNEFRLYEDDGNTMSFENGAFCETPFIVNEDNSTVTFTIKNAEGDTSVVPEKRNYLLKFRDIVKGDIKVTVNGETKEFTETNKNGYVEILLNDITPSDEAIVTLSVCTYLANKEKKEELIDVISKFQISNENKRLFNEVLKDDMFLNKVPKKYREPLMEITALYRG